MLNLPFELKMMVSNLRCLWSTDQRRVVLNVSFKIFTKVGTNRLNKIAQTVVSPTQTAFMPGRNIIEGVVILHETIHELHTKKKNGVI